MKKLPSTPSKLITLALDDLAKVEKMKGYQVDMRYWHTSQTGLGDQTVCSVCLAGAVMVCELKANRAETHFPWSLGADNYDKLKALDLFRRGTLLGGIEFLRKIPTSETKRAALDRIIGRTTIVPYTTDKKRFKVTLRAFARSLSGIGL